MRQDRFGSWPVTATLGLTASSAPNHETVTSSSVGMILGHHHKLAVHSMQRDDPMSVNDNGAIALDRTGTSGLDVSFGSTRPAHARTA
jgi:hypothetical protein